MPGFLRRRAGIPRAVGAACIVAGGVASLPLRGGVALGQTRLSYSGTAASDGTRLTVTIPNFIAVDTPVDGGGPTAQARLDSFGTSTAFASAPYPGDAGANLPSLIAGFTGAPVPAYPLIVTASYPAEPSKQFGADGYQLNADAAPDRSAATATAGQPTPTSTGSRSAATVHEATDGTVVATATSDIGLVVAGDLQLQGVYTVAQVRLNRDRTVTRTTDMRVGRITVSGSGLGLGPGAVTLGGSTIPTGPATQPFIDALRAAGVTLEVVQPQQTKDSVLSPALKLTRVQPVPGLGRTATVTYLLGQATAAVTPQSAPNVAAAPPPDVAPSTSPAGIPVPSAAPSQGGSSVTPATGTHRGHPTVRRANGPPVDAATTVGAIFDFGKFYWVLVLAGALLLVCGETTRAMGVRST